MSSFTTWLWTLTFKEYNVRRVSGNLFTDTLSYGTCNQMVQKIFQHSGETISRHFEKMITLLGARFTVAYVKPSDPTFNEVPTKI